ncbi:MAG: hypothetical protein RLN83_08545 [Balneola sp.]
MKSLTIPLFKAIIQSQVFSMCLSITLIFFLCKGILYALIGSFVPLLFIITILCLFLFSITKSPGAFKRTLTMWSVLLILWSATRLFLSIINEFVTHIPEGHIDGQLGLMSVLISMSFLVFSFYMLKNRTRILQEIAQE